MQAALESSAANQSKTRPQRLRFLTSGTVELLCKSSRRSSMNSSTRPQAYAVVVPNCSFQPMHLGDTSHHLPGTGRFAKHHLSKTRRMSSVGSAIREQIRCSVVLLQGTMPVQEQRFMSERPRVQLTCTSDVDLKPSYKLPRCLNASPGFSPKPFDAC